MNKWLHTPLIVLLLLLEGCVAIDPRVDKEERKQVDSVEAFSGVYQNKPIYSSESAGFVGNSDFADVIGVYYTSADSFRITSHIDKGIQIDLMKDGNIVGEKLFTFDGGLLLTREGLIKLPKETEAGSHDSPVIGVASRQYSIFLNNDNNLVVVNSGGGAGLVGVIPMAVYGKLMSIFPRLQ